MAKIKARFSPKTQEVAPIDEKYSKEDIAAAQAQVELEQKDKGMSVVQKLNVVWTIVSTIYAIVSTCMFVAKKWVDSSYAYALIPMLAVLIVTFAVLVALTFKDKKKLQSNVKNYKKVLGIFKAFVNVFFLAITAVSMVGLAKGETSVGKWIVFGATFFVALVQLVLKITKFAMKLARKAVAKKFKVEVQRFVDGKKQKKTVADALNEQKYKQ